MFVLCECSRDMKLHDYLDALATADRLAFAAGAGIDDKYLAQLKSSAKLGRGRFPSLALCKKFIDLSVGEFAVPSGPLSLEELRPDIYGTATEAA